MLDAYDRLNIVELPYLRTWSYISLWEINVEMWQLRCQCYSQRVKPIRAGILIIDWCTSDILQASLRHYTAATWYTFNMAVVTIVDTVASLSSRYGDLENWEFESMAFINSPPECPTSLSVFVNERKQANWVYTVHQNTLCEIHIRWCSICMEIANTRQLESFCRPRKTR